MTDAEVSTRTDWVGTVHAPAQTAPRIACLVPSLTELLFSLGLGPFVVARTGFCIHPREGVRSVAKVGGTKDPDLDQLRALAPTHLLVNVDENRLETVTAARSFVPNVIVTHPERPDDNLRLYRLLGAIFGRTREAECRAGRMRDALEALRRAVAELPRESVLYLIWKRPWMTVAPGTYVANTLAAAGWDVVTVDGSTARYPALASADPAWRRARRLLVSSEPYAFRPRDAAEIAAAYDRPAHLVDGEMTSWYGPRAIAGLAYLADLRRATSVEGGQAA